MLRPLLAAERSPDFTSIQIRGGGDFGNSQVFGKFVSSDIFARQPASVYGRSYANFLQLRLNMVDLNRGNTFVVSPAGKLYLMLHT